MTEQENIQTILDVTQWVIAGNAGYVASILFDELRGWFPAPTIEQFRSAKRFRRFLYMILWSKQGARIASWVLTSLLIDIASIVLVIMYHSEPLKFRHILFAIIAGQLRHILKTSKGIVITNTDRAFEIPYDLYDGDDINPDDEQNK